MGRTPRKPSFTDVVLPIFDQPVEEKKTRTKKQEAADGKVRWTRHAASPRANCNVCLDEFTNDLRKGMNVASYVRTAPDGVLYLCFLHTQEQKHRDQLAGLDSGNA